ncbi:ATP-binding protein [Actinoallomurus sp. NPDC050550]|uniref:ATP-binding protein n=1 Tax=Actinoallomurus sp. NPDC050550 TaxID=3154937 RepID=UPI0033D559F0
MGQMNIEMENAERLTIKGRPEMARNARAFARASLGRLGCSPNAIDDGELIICELVTNAIKAAPGQEIKISIFPLRKYVVMCVYDPGDGLPRQKQAGSHDVSGRGIPIVKQCARRYGAFEVVGGKIVWAMVGRQA